MAWQQFVYGMFDYHICRPDRNSSLQSRKFVWNHFIAPTFEFLRDYEGLIPVAVEIIRCHEDVDEREAVPQRLLGERPSKPIEKWATKLMVNISLARKDAEYLDEVRDALAHRRATLERCLLRWWDQVKRHYEYGQARVKAVDWKKLDAEIESGRYIIRPNNRSNGQYHFAVGVDGEEIGKFLAMLTRDHNGVFKNQTLEEDPRLPRPGTIKFLPDAPAVVSNLVTKTQRLNWMLGNLCSMDIAVCMAILIMRNPKFTPHALLNAKILDAHGRNFLEIGDERVSYRVNKARAKSMKSSALDELSVDIVRTVIDMGRTHRLRFKNESSPLSNFLFFVTDAGRRAPPSPSLARLLSGTQQFRRNGYIGNLFPELGEAGLTVGTITFAKIRHTEGVLEWFRKGTLGAMSRMLGNKKRVSVNHYLPKALLTVWNARLIRRFQNLWISIAAAKEDFLLEVTDFHSLSELHEFLTQMLSHHRPDSSPLAEALHEVFATAKGFKRIASKGAVKDAFLSVPISKQTLSALYLYQDSCLSAGVAGAELDRRQTATSITPRQFLDLAELMRHRLPEHRDSAIREAHEAAVKLADELRSKVKWQDLFLNIAR